MCKLTVDMLSVWWRLVAIVWDVHVISDGNNGTESPLKLPIRFAFELEDSEERQLAVSDDDQGSE
jgi:hypothetical protein